MFQIHHVGILVIGAVLSFLLLLLFVIPLLRGYRHAGTVIGSAFCLLLMAFFCGNRWVGKLLDTVWSHEHGHIILCVLIGMLAAAFLADVVCGILMLWVLRKRPKKAMPAVLVQSDAGERRSERQMERRHAVLEKYLTAHPGACVILCGSAQDQARAESALLGQSISPERIRKAQPSASLQEQLRCAQAYLGEHRLGTKAVIVTEYYMQYRASLYARELGLDARHLAVGTAWYLHPSFWIRESFLLCLRFL